MARLYEKKTKQKTLVVGKPEENKDFENQNFTKQP